MNELIEKFLTQEKRVHEETRKLDLEMGKLNSELTAKRIKSKKALEKQESILSKLIEDYLNYEKKVLSEISSVVNAEEVTREKLKNGKVSIKEYLMEGKDAVEVEAISREKANNKLKPVRMALKEKSIEVLKLQAEVAGIEYELAYAIAKPLSNILERLESSKDVFTQRQNNILSGYEQKQNIFKMLEDDIKLSESKSLLKNRIWDNLTKKQIADMRFNPIIPEVTNPTFDNLINSLENGKLYSFRVIFRDGLNSSVQPARLEAQE